MSALDCDLDSPVPDWVIEYPQTLRIFQELGIDYCCAGKSLAYACRQQGLDPHAVLRRIAAEVAAMPRD